ncbi:MAG: ERCC4 domain-containing protein [Desulfurococcaceae archaeon]
MLLVPVDVVIDSREDSKHPEFRKFLEQRGLRVSVQRLGAGDFLLLAPPGRRSVLVERKTVADFANSIRDGRLWDQARRLAEAARVDGHAPLMVVEGWLGSLERTGWRIQSVLRAMDELVLDVGVPILNTPGPRATAEWVAAKAASLGETSKKTVQRLRVEKKPMELMDRILYVAEGLAGPTLARRLLDRFCTLRDVANAGIQDLMQVEGIGERRATEIFMIFNTRWSGCADGKR